MLRPTSTHPSELSPAKSLIRNADTNSLAWSSTAVANLQLRFKYTLIFPKNSAVRTDRFERIHAFGLPREKIVLHRVESYALVVLRIVSAGG